MERVLIEKEIYNEINTEQIRRLFVESLSEKVEFYATHLMRPDGFAKTLITGSIVSSSELQNKIGRKFTKTNRGYYMRYPPSYEEGENDYISFNVGCPQRMYQEEDTIAQQTNRNWEEGFGFALPAKKLLDSTSVQPSWGNFHLKETIKKLKNNPLLSEPKFEKYYNLSKEKVQEFDLSPLKDDFLTFTHMARKAGYLTEDNDDQAEINMQKEDNKFPRLSLQNVVILIPLSAQESFKHYLNKKIREIQPFREKIKETFGVDILNITADIVLGQYKNIYWYPQKNIRSAIEYLSIYPEKIS